MRILMTPRPALNVEIEEIKVVLNVDMDGAIYSAVLGEIQEWNDGDICPHVRLLCFGSLDGIVVVSDDASHHFDVVVELHGDLVFRVDDEDLDAQNVSGLGLALLERVDHDVIVRADGLEVLCSELKHVILVLRLEWKHHNLGTKHRAFLIVKFEVTAGLFHHLLCHVEACLHGLLGWVILFQED